MSIVMKLTDIHKHYYMGDNDLHVLKGINFEVNHGELLSIMGASGSCKSTLMNIIGLLDHPTSGSYKLDGKEVSTFTGDDRAMIRNQMIGFVFQQFFLLPRLTAVQNVAMPLIYRGINKKESYDRCMESLKKVGMIDYHDHRPSEMSGGQQQRVAIARALIGEPSIILGDEPTGALDSKIGQEVMDLFIRLNEEEKKTLVLVTHDPKVSAQCQRTVHVKDGLVVDDERR